MNKLILAIFLSIALTLPSEARITLDNSLVIEGNYSTQDFDHLSPTAHRRRGYDEMGLLPEYKIRLKASLGSYIGEWQFDEMTLKRLHPLKRRRIEKHLLDMPFSEYYRHRGIPVSIDSLIEPSDYTMDLIEEYHDGKGLIRIKLNKSLLRSQIDEHLAPCQQGAYPPVMMIEGNNW